MANNVAQTGMAMFAALVNGIKKAIYGKDEAINEADEEVYREEGILSRLVSFFTLKSEDKDSKSKSHLNNKAKNITQRRSKKEYITQNEIQHYMKSIQNKILVLMKY